MARLYATKGAPVADVRGVLRAGFGGSPPWFEQLGRLPRGAGRGYFHAVPRESAPPVSLRELIAANLRRLRLAAGREPDDLIPVARAHGLDWTVSWLGAVERGTRALTGEQLVALPVVLSTALGHRVSLADLLIGDAPVTLGGADDRSGASVPAAYLLDVVTGHPVRRSFTATPPPPAVDAGAGTARAGQRMRDILDAGLGNVDARALARAEQGTGAVEAKLAKRLGVAPVVVAAAAASLWGRSVTEEQAALVDGGASAAAAARTVGNAVGDKLRDAAMAVVEARLAALTAPADPPDTATSEEAAPSTAPHAAHSARQGADTASETTGSGRAPDWPALGSAPAW